LNSINKNDKIKVLKICINTSDYSDSVTYKIFYEFSNVLGLAEATVLGSGYTHISFTILTVYDVLEMYNLSSIIKMRNL
jgi:hypothetical protein